MPTADYTQHVNECQACNHRRTLFLDRERIRGGYSRIALADLSSQWDMLYGKRHMREIARQVPVPDGLPALDPYATRDPRNNYTYKPRWRMRGNGPPFYGMELEITCRDFTVMNHADAMTGQLAFLKRDSSVDGFEMVTHPMTCAYFMDNFPWPMLGVLQAEGCSINPRVNGLHIHVSRDGFKNHSHQLRWLKLIYRNQRQMERLGRRRSTYGTFSPDVRKSQLDHVIWQKECDRYEQLRREIGELSEEAYQFRHDPLHEIHTRLDAKQTEQERLAGRITRLRRADRSRSLRYSAVNVRPTTTYEMRFMASSLGELEVKSAIQLAAATVEYTRHLTAHDVAAGEAWRWRNFRAWVKQNGGYPELRKADLHAVTSESPQARYTMSANTIRS